MCSPVQYTTTKSVVVEIGLKTWEHMAAHEYREGSVGAAAGF